MRSILFLLAFVFYFFDSTGQSIKVKKGSLLMDKVHVATFEGKINLLKTDLNLKALDNSTLFTLKSKYFGTDLPQYESFEFYEINFPKSEKTVLFYKTIMYYNEKQISKVLFVDMGLKINGNEIDAGSLTKFIEENDKAAKIAEDTVKTRDLENMFAEKLAENQIERDKTAKINLKPLPSEDKDVAINEMRQADVLLGTFSIKKTIKQMPSGSATSVLSEAERTIITYIIEKQIKTPFEFDGTKYDKAIVAFLRVEGGSLRYFYTFQDKRLQSHTSIKLEGKEKDIEKVCKYLIENEYL